MEWRPIDSAPRDGAIIDLWVPESDGGYRVTDCYWSEIDGRWRQVGGTGHPAALLEPSHWLPLPPPPGDQDGMLTLTGCARSAQSRHIQ